MRRRVTGDHVVRKGRLPQQENQQWPACLSVQEAARTERPNKLDQRHTKSVRAAAATSASAASAAVEWQHGDKGSEG